MTGIASLALSAAGCLAVEGDRITAGDLAARVAALAPIPAHTVFGFAPRFGVRRTIPGFELAAFARKHGVELRDAPELCVTRPGRTLSAEEAIAAMRASAPEASIELLDLARQPVPNGTVEFPCAGLSVSGLWRGFVRTAEGRRFPVWAKVEASVEAPVTVAAEPLKPNEPIGKAQIKVETRRRHPAAPAPLADSSAAVGKCVRRLVEAGEPLFESQLTSPREVAPGSTVVVEAGAGAAKLSVEAKAETGGRRGERILLKNVSSGKRFYGIVAGPGRATAEEFHAKN
ncbi:MAG: flagellar basal body P-ring formation chaperone FlgA [Bryobacteraceae bacterium]|nr:flagellar basal body P-ring formation chaperone FlgA [Bryobacteraceae bacterium]